MNATGISASPGGAQRTRLLGVDFDDVTRDQVLSWIEACIARRDRPRMICTPNADHLLLMRRDAEFRRIVAKADLVVPDGMGVVYAAKLLSRTFKQNVGGRLLLPAFAAIAARRHYRLFLLGGRDAAQVEAAVTRLTEQNPGLEICGYAPPFRQEFTEGETRELLRIVRAAAPDVLFVCLGTPKQEKWIGRNLEKIGVPVCIGVGAALDVVSGRVREPPRWMTDVGLEWLFKLCQEPRRLWRRYGIGVPRFALLVMFEWLRITILNKPAVGNPRQIRRNL